MTPVEATYGAFSQRVHGGARGARVPLEGTIEVSHRCPLDCRHCYNNLPMGDGEARELELSLAEHRRLVDEIAEAGCLWLLYTGGEILARPDFLEIYTHARRAGLLVTLFTNGTLITPRIADHLAAYRPFAIEITLYGATRETYDTLTRVPGSFDRCWRGIHLLLERRLPLKLKTVAVSVNRHEVWAMKRQAEELGVDFKFDTLMSPRIDCSHSPLAVRLPPDEAVAFDWDDPFRAAEWRRQLPLMAAAAAEQAETREVYHCGGGMSSFAVDPYGRMSICTLSHRDTWDLRAGSFREGWEHFIAGVRARRATVLTKCTDCRLKAACTNCPATAELENGSPESAVDYLCRVGHLRALVFGMEIPPHGDCEYCPGGQGHAGLARQAAALRARPEGTESVFARAPLSLPVLGMSRSSESGCGSGGCAACR